MAPPYTRFNTQPPCKSMHIAGAPQQRKKKKASYNTSLRTIRVYFQSCFFFSFPSFFLLIYLFLFIFFFYFFFFTHSWTKPGYTHPLPGNSFSCLTQNTFHPHSFLALYSHLLNTRNSERRYDYRCASSCIFSTFLETFLAIIFDVKYANAMFDLSVFWCRIARWLRCSPRANAVFNSPHPPLRCPRTCKSPIFISACPLWTCVKSWKCLQKL